MRGSAVSSGTSPLYPSIETRFNEGSAPGLIAQPNYLHADVAIDADTRDVPGYPSSGGRYRASLAAFQDRDFGRYSFRRFEAEAVQYLPVSDWSVVSVRGRMDLSQTGAGQQVPFYMLPTLGNGQSLRGYADYRFRDRDLTLVNAEYRLRVARPIDAAVFYDAGTVAPSAIDALAMRQLKTDYGVGLRIHSSRQMIVRLDVARSHEGMQAIVAVTPSLGFTRQTVAPYVP
jgi:outer membrane protein assembly factor BamA